MKPSTTGFSTADRWLLAATILASSMAFIDGTAVNTALPVMQRELAAEVDAMQWVVESYMLFLSALLLVGGALGDRFGRARIFAAGTVLFTAASIWCGLAPDTAQLILARAVQGVGGALLVPGSLALLRASITPEVRGQAIGTWSAFTALTTALGQVLGGWLAEEVTWRAIFLLNLPIGLAVLLIARRHVPESRDPDAPARTDWAGALLAVVGLGATTFGLIESSHLGWRHPWVVGGLALGAAALVGFFWREARAPHPMMPLGLFRDRVFAATNMLTLLLYAALGGALFFLPFNLIQVQGYTATAAGLAMLPFIALLFTLSSWAGRLADRRGPRLPLTIGPVVAGAGFALLALPGVGGGYWTTFFPAIAVLGLGMAITVAPLTTAVLNAVPEHRAGLASGINNAVSRVAGLLAIAGLGIGLVGGFTRSLDRRLAALPLPPEAVRALEENRVMLAAMPVPTDLDPALAALVQASIDGAFVDGFRWVALVCAALAVAGGAIARWGLSSPEGDRG